MESVWIVLIIIFVLAIISIVIAVAVVAINKGSTVNNTCVAQSDCSIGYVCSNIGTGGTGTCRAGLGTSCSSNNDCADTLICTNGRCLNITPTLRLPGESINPKATQTMSGPTASSILESKNSDSKTLEQVFRSPTLIAPSPATATPITPNADAVKQEDTIQTRSVIKYGTGGITPLTPCDMIQSKQAIVSTRENKSIVNDSRKIIPRIHTEVTSIDDEVNSIGLIGDAPFDFRSADTREIGSHGVSTPYEVQEGKYYCRTEMLDRVVHSPVIDVCSYSNATIFLLKDGNVICEVQDGSDKQRRRAHNNIPLSRITSFIGYLYGVGVDGKLYTLPNTYFSSTDWVWDPVSWAPDDIKYISSTYNSSHLWIQTANVGILYKGSGNVVSKLENFIMRRVYGRDIEHYIDIDPLRFIAVVQPGNISLTNIYDAALSYYDEVVAIHPADRDEYHRITIVNWNPYYIRT